MRGVAQHPVELILMKQWASYIRVPVFLVDAAGTLIFYNEPAEVLLGQTFDEAGEMRVEELGSIFKVTAPDGGDIPGERIPIAVALLERRPAHMRMNIEALDGRRRLIDVTAFPIEGHAQRHLGAVSMFWEPDA
jgi:hypothetical protein